MAEIRVEPKKQTSASWVWIAIVVLLAAALVYYLITRQKTADATPPPANTTGKIYHPSPIRSLHDLLLPNPTTYIC